MGKILYLVFSQICENAAKHMVLVIEFVISIIAIHIVLCEFLVFEGRAGIYKELELNQYICISAEDEIQEKLKQNKEVDWFSENYAKLFLNIGDEGNLSASIYTKAQAEHLQYPVRGDGLIQVARDWYCKLSFLSHYQIR